jgi:hypothetical protein
MKIPKYWARDTQTVSGPSGESVSFSCWRWSDSSYDEAKERARRSAREIAWKLLNRQPLDRYAYGERPMREEIVQPIHNDDGNEIGVITRNAYGALVLNAANAMFMDIDFPDEKRKGQSVNHEAVALQSVEQWARAHPEWGVRIYRTFGGLRCLITNEVFEPSDASAIALLQSLKCDPLYVALCRQQACFRARLTPKPWRFDFAMPPARYPWLSQAAESAYRQWENEYQRAIASYTVCKLLKHVGRSDVHPDVGVILALHDQVARKSGSLRLA